jgi:hypothetical protein
MTINIYFTINATIYHIPYKYYAVNMTINITIYYILYKYYAKNMTS